MRHALRLALAAFVLVLGACASVPHATPERDAEAKRFLTHPGTATLYVYRPEFASAEMDESVLYVGNRLIGATLPGTYFRVDLRPGPHLLRGYGHDLGRLQVELHSEEIAFVALGVFAGHSHFTRVEPERAKREIVRCCVLLENWAPGQRPLLR